MYIHILRDFPLNCVAGGSPLRKVLTNDSDERRSGNVQLVAREEPTLRTGNQRKQWLLRC